MILSVEADSVLLVAEGLAGLTLGDYHGGTGLGILELVEVSLLMPSSQTWALLFVAFEAITGIFLVSLLDHSLLGRLHWPDSEISNFFLFLAVLALLLNLAGLLFNLKHEILGSLGSVSKTGVLTPIHSLNLSEHQWCCLLVGGRVSEFGL